MKGDNNRVISQGSGFFVRPDVIVTNYHVIEGAREGAAKVVGKPASYRVEGVLGIDREKDLVLLKLSGIVGRPLRLGDVSKVEVGQEIFAFGSPKGLEGTVSSGIVSGLNLRQLGSESLIQITAPISPGSSGGPVVDRKGGVVGIAIASLKDGQNLNFAIPAPYLALLLTNLKPLTALSDLRIVSKNDDSTRENLSIGEIAAWLTDKLSAKGGLSGSFTEKNEKVVFNNCTMGLVYSSRLNSFGFNYRYIVQLNKVIRVEQDNEENIVMYFAPDDLQYEKDEVFRDNVEKTTTHRHNALNIWVGDSHLGARVIKAFREYVNQCKEAAKPEPF
jgi:hypothetical protein